MSNETSLLINISDENCYDNFEKIKNGILKIYMDAKSIGWFNDKSNKPKAYLSIKSLKKLAASSGADVFTADILTANGFIMKCSIGAHVSYGGTIQYNGNGTVKTLKANSRGSVTKV